MCALGGGGDLIYSSSQDHTLIVWETQNGAVRHILRGHAHWVNSFSLNTELVLRSGAFDHRKKTFTSPVDAAAYAEVRYQETLRSCGGGERLVSCSDDCTLFLWNPKNSSRPFARLLGHRGLVYTVQFSPDGALIASGSGDKCVKIWRSSDGVFLLTLRNHVGAVYHVAWSLDSRLLVSASKDSTIKLWEAVKGRMLEHLPGPCDF